MMPDEMKKEWTNSDKEKKTSGYLTATMMGFEALVRILCRKNLITKEEVTEEMKILHDEMNAAIATEVERLEKAKESKKE